MKTNIKTFSRILFKSLLITTLFCMCCKPKPITPPTPSGANIIRYKANGQQIEITGKYNSFTGNGVSYGENPPPYNSINFGGNFNDNKCTIILDKTKSSGKVFSDSLNNFLINNINGQLYSKYYSMFLEFSHNNSSFISGSFQGRVYYNPFNQNSGDSLSITEGYFDISKN